MDDAARSWVSPFCMLSEPGTEVFQFSVWVLHPGPQYVGDATVTVRLYNCITGDLAKDFSKAVSSALRGQ